MPKSWGGASFLTVLYRASVSADHANQITIDGIIVNDYGDGNNGGYAINRSEMPPMSTVNNFKAYSCKRWTDGIDTFSCFQYYHQ